MKATLEGLVEAEIVNESLTNLGVMNRFVVAQNEYGLLEDNRVFPLYHPPNV